jgi:hypothetical protein
VFCNYKNGGEIIAMLEAAGPGQKTDSAKPDNTAHGNETRTKNKSEPNNPNDTAANTKRTGGAPSNDEIKKTMEKCFEDRYETWFHSVKSEVMSNGHFCCRW